MTAWHVITGEYPPQAGGVSDYTRLVARGLIEAGDAVTIWAPPIARSESTGEPRDACDEAVVVNRLPDRFGRASLRTLDRALDAAPAPRRILIQYVPHAFGWKALNLPFSWWVRSRRRDSVWVMFHEVAFPVDRRQTFAHNALGLVTRRMAAGIADASERMFVSIPAWERELRALASSTAPVEWLPVPSAIAVVDRPQAVNALRVRLGAGRPLVGHFGTYGAHTRPLVEAAVGALLRESDCGVVLLGRESDAVARAVTEANPSVRDRVHGTGALAAGDVSLHLAACDVMLQPYPDGISTRRTSAMAALSHGRAVATTDGALTEPVWRESGAVVLAPAGDTQALVACTLTLAHDRARAERLGDRARALYDARFDIRHTIRALAGGKAAVRVA